MFLVELMCFCSGPRVHFLGYRSLAVMY